MTLGQSLAGADPPDDDASDRVRLARVALQAALGLADVVRGEAGRCATYLTEEPSQQLVEVAAVAEPSEGTVLGVSVTAQARRRLVGVLAIAQADGRYEVDLRLAVRPVALPALGEHIRDRVHAAAARAGLVEILGDVNVEFADIVPVTEPADQPIEPEFGDALHGSPAGPPPLEGGLG